MKDIVSTSTSEIFDMIFINEFIK